MSDAMTAEQLDALAALYEAAEQFDPWSDEISAFMREVPKLFSLARDGITSRRKLEILYDIGVSDEDNAEMQRRYDAETAVPPVEPSEGGGDDSI